MNEITNHINAYYKILQADFYAFAVRAFKELQPDTAFLGNWHLEVIAAELERTRLGKERRQIINLPPRSLKAKALRSSFEPPLRGLLSLELLLRLLVLLLLAPLLPLLALVLRVRVVLLPERLWVRVAMLSSV